MLRISSPLKHKATEGVDLGHHGAHCLCSCTQGKHSSSVSWVLKLLSRWTNQDTQLSWPLSFLRAYWGIYGLHGISADDGKPQHSQQNRAPSLLVCVFLAVSRVWSSGPHKGLNGSQWPLPRSTLLLQNRAQISTNVRANESQTLPVAISTTLCHQLTEQACWATFSFLCVADTGPAGLTVCVTKQCHHTDAMVSSPRALGNAHPSHTGNVRHRSRRVPRCSAVTWVGTWGTWKTVPWFNWRWTDVIGIVSHICGLKANQISGNIGSPTLCYFPPFTRKSKD